MCLEGIDPYHLSYQILWAESILLLYYAFNAHGISSNVLFLISNGSFSLFYLTLTRGLSIYYFQITILWYSLIFFIGLITNNFCTFKIFSAYAGFYLLFI